MKNAIFEGMKRLIRHGLAPVVAYLVAEGMITEEQGLNLTNAALVIGATAFSIIWSWARVQFPMIRFL